LLYLDTPAQVAQGYQYIEDLYTAGAGSCFDAVAIHPYDDGARGSEVQTTLSLVLENRQ